MFSWQTQTLTATSKSARPPRQASNFWKPTPTGRLFFFLHEEYSVNRKQKLLWINHPFNHHPKIIRLIPAALPRKTHPLGELIFQRWNEPLMLRSGALCRSSSSMILTTMKVHGQRLLII